MQTGSAIRRLQLDLLQGEPAPLPKPSGDDPAGHQQIAAWAPLTSWRAGLLVVRDGRAFWLLPSQLLLQGMARPKRQSRPPAPGQILAAALTALGLPPDAWTDPSVALWRFQTSGWVEDARQERALPWVQGIVPAGGADRATLLASARAGGDYLLRIQADDGAFSYVYDPWLGTRTTRANNIVRHAGTAWSLFDLGAATGDARYLEAAGRAVAFLTRYCRTDSTGEREYVLDTNGKAKLGGIGLGLLALTRKLDLAPEPGDRERAIRLARQIEAMQNVDGSFESFLPIRGDEPPGSHSLYYPGEAILGLARLARSLGDPRFLGAAHRGAEYLIRSRVGLTKLPPDAWLVQALEDLYQHQPNPAYLGHAIDLAMSMLADQYPDEAPPGFVGGFAPEPIRSARTSARAEGLLPAYWLATAAGDPRAATILAGLRRLTPLLLALQYGPDNSFFLPDASPAAGGVRGGLDDAAIQIDYVQHHVSAVLGLAALPDA